MIEPDVVVVPAGDALLGDPPRTEHVNIFAIARRPVSVGEYAMFVDATQHHPPMGWEQKGRATGAVISSFAVASIAGLPAGLMLAEWFGRGAPFVALAGLSALVWLLNAGFLYAVARRELHRRIATSAQPDTAGSVASPQPSFPSTMCD